MGWIYMPKGQRTVREILTAEIEKNDGHQVVDIWMKAGTAYAAVQRLKDGRPVIYPIIFLYRLQPKDRHGLTFGYKDIDEEMGPVARHCPARILDRLTAVEDLYGAGTDSARRAQKWRDDCRANMEARFNGRLRVGTVVEFEKPRRFADGYEGRRFRLGRVDERTVWRAENGRLYCIPNWRTVPLRVIETP